MDNNISRREFLKRSGLLALSAALSPLLSSCSVGQDRSACLTILHANDVHSHIDPFPLTDERYPGMGGYAKRQALIESVRAEQGADRVMVFESGDMFQGTPYFNHYRGQLEIKLMNMMHVDAVTIGNHEFDNGVDALCDCMEMANFPFIASNYIFSDARGSKLVKPYRVFERGGMRVGVFGIGVKMAGLIGPTNCAGVTYADPVITAQQMADTLRHREKCDLVIALTHIGFAPESNLDICDTLLAARTEGIDIILGGHSHTFLERPEIVMNKAGQPVVINQAGFAGINVGKLVIRQREGGKLALADSQAVTIVA